MTPSRRMTNARSAHEDDEAGRLRIHDQPDGLERIVPAVTVAAGATFAFSGNMTLADNAELTITYPLAETAPITVSGQLTLGKNVKVRPHPIFGFRPERCRSFRRTSELSDAENLSTRTAVGPGDRTYKLVRTDETLSVVVPGGFMILVK